MLEKGIGRGKEQSAFLTPFRENQAVVLPEEESKAMG